MFSHSCLEVLTVITDFHNAFEIGNIDWITYAKEIAEASVQPCSLQEIAAVQEIKYETDSIVDHLNQQLKTHQERLAQHQRTLVKHHETLAEHKMNLAQYREDLAEHQANLDNLNNLIALPQNVSTTIKGKYKK